MAASRTGPGVGPFKWVDHARLFVYLVSVSVCMCECVGAIVAVGPTATMSTRVLQRRWKSDAVPRQ